MSLRNLGIVPFSEKQSSANVPFHLTCKRTSMFAPKKNGWLYCSAAHEEPTNTSHDRYQYAPTIPLNEKRKGYVQETNEAISKCHCTTSP